MLELLIAFGLQSIAPISDTFSLAGFAKGLIGRIGEKNASEILKKALDETIKKSEDEEAKGILKNLKKNDEVLRELQKLEVNEEAKKSLVSQYLKGRENVFDDLAKNYYELFCKEATKKDGTFKEFVVIELGKLVSQGIITNEAIIRVENYLEGIKTGLAEIKEDITEIKESVAEFKKKEKKDLIREIKLKQIDSSLISEALPERISEFYSGESPSPTRPSAWGVIAANGDVKRDQEEEIEQALQEDDNFHIICIVAEPGAGKTTLAMRALYKLSQREEYVFWLADSTEYNRQFWDGLSELAESIKTRFYVFIDDIFRDRVFVKALQNNMDKGGLPVTIIATSRTNEYKDHGLKEFIKKVELKLSEKEKKDLLERVGKSYVDLSPDARKVFDVANLFLVLGMVLSKGKGFSEIIKDVVDGLKEKDEALYRAYEYVCFSSNYDISIPEDLLAKLDKQGRFYGLLEKDTAKGIFYEDAIPWYTERLIKAGHYLIAKEALHYYSRYPKVLFEEILEAADEENWMHRRYIAHLTRAILEEGREISNKDIKDIVTKSLKITHILYHASITELNVWQSIYKQLNLQEEAKKCAEEILLRAPDTPLDCQLLISELLSRRLADRAFSTIREWLEEHPEDRVIFMRYLSLVKDRGDTAQTEEAIKEATAWLRKNPEDDKVRNVFLSIVKDKGGQEQIEKALEETPLWLKDHPEDNEVRVGYLSLVKEKGSKEQIEEKIEATTKWLKDHPDDNTVREAWLVLIRDEGNQEQIRRGIGDTISWSKDYPEDNKIRSVFLSLVRDKGFFKEEDIKWALDDVEQWMKKYGLHPLFKDYITLVEKIRKTETDVDIDIELVKQFGYKFINSCRWEYNIRPIRDFADWLRSEKFFDDAEQIYERLLKTKMRDFEKSTIYFSYGKMFLGQAMNLEFSNEERLKKLKKAEKKFREVLEVRPKYHMAHAFLAITLNELGENYEAKYEFNDAEWRAPFDEKRKMLFIGSIPPKLELKNILDGYIIPNEIKNIFEAEGKTLSENALVKKKEKIKNRWIIKDKELYYLIIEEKEKLGSNIARLNIYGDYHPGRLPYKIGNFYLEFNRYKEAIRWLKIAVREEPENFTNWWKSGYVKKKLAYNIEERGFHKEAKDLFVEALSELETAWDIAPESLQLPASRDIPAKIEECKRFLFMEKTEKPKEAL